MSIIGRFWSVLGKVIHGDPTGRTVILTSCDGPFRDRLEGLVTSVQSVDYVPGARAALGMLLALPYEIQIAGRAIRFLSALPRHVGYDQYALSIVPIAVNLVARENATDPICYDDFVGIGMARIKK